MKKNYSKRKQKENKELIKLLKSYLRQNSSKFLENKNIPCKERGKFQEYFGFHVTWDATILQKQTFHFGCANCD